jgi:hypothetical protein
MTTTKGHTMSATPKRDHLMDMAERLNTLRAEFDHIPGLDLEGMFPDYGPYGHVKQALIATLRQVCGTGNGAMAAYGALLDGATVREALGL